MQLRTPSPRNSSRSLWGVLWLRCVSACTSSRASRNRWPRRSCRASYFTSIDRLRTGRLARTREVDEQADVVKERDALLVRERDDDLAAILGDLEILRADRGEIVDRLAELEGPADVRHRRVAELSARGDRRDRLLDREVLEVRRHHLHPDDGQENDADEDRQHPREAHPALSLHGTRLP